MPVPDAATPPIKRSESPGRPRTSGRPVSRKRIAKIPAKPNVLMAPWAVQIFIGHIVPGATEKTRLYEP